MPVPDFSPGEVLTAAAMDSIGLWLVKTQTITVAGASITVANAFNANFANYRIVLSDLVGSSAGGNLEIQLNASTGNTYFTGGNFMSFGNSTLNGFGPAASSFWTVGPYNNVQMATVLDVFNPQVLKQSFFIGTGVTTASLYQFSGSNTNTAQSTGFTITNSVATNFTAGTIRVYGYRN